jgi:glycosyltransferase involved in cell wall biosynthesis
MTQVVCVAAYQRDQILDLFDGETRERMASRISVSPMGLDVARFAVPRAPRLPEDRPTVLGVGRLTPIKGFDRLIRACRGLDVNLSLVGEGPERHALARLARRENVPLRLWGAVTPRHLLSLYAQADILAVPSRRLGLRVEGTPRVLLEGMAAGLAIVASRHGGISDVVRHGENGLLEDGAESSLKANLSLLVADPELRVRLGEQARTLSWRYDWRAVAPDLLAPFA